MSKALVESLIKPSWPAPPNVNALQTTRVGGLSAAPYDSFNLGDHVGDHPHHVAHNRQQLNNFVPTEPVWLNQVHGVRVIDAALSRCVECADASFSTNRNVVCTVMTADCLPILLCDKAGTVVASIHAGWRSLCDGVIEETISAMPAAVGDLMVWFGPAIGPGAFEVDAKVREQFLAKDVQAERAFKPHGDKWLCDLYQVAKLRLKSLGVTDLYGEVLCTYENPDEFFSYRRDGDTGRMATMIWLSA